MYSVCVLFVALSISRAHAEVNNVIPCTTPDKERAFCIPLFSCPGLVKSIATLEPSAIKYFKLSMCLGCKAGNFMVCCGQENLIGTDEKLAPPVTSVTVPSTSTSPRPPPKNEPKRDLVLRTLMPDRRYCGLQHTDDRFYNNPVAALDEFPWLVHIKFTDIYSAYKLGDRCTGVLLNTKYVLTDTICANSALKVRLGQYDVAHKVTCIQDPQAHECSEGTIEVKVEKKIDLQPDVSYLYALSLLRLANNVEYSDFVRPICLPLKEANRASTEDPLTFSGWGTRPASTVLEDAIKKRLVYDTISIDGCEAERPLLESLVEEGSVPFLTCFAPQNKNKDSACHGDHGGPLMYKNSNLQWYVEHVVLNVAYTATECSRDSTVLAVKITPKLIDTILENIEP